MKTAITERHRGGRKDGDMCKEEFQNLIGMEVSDEDYAIIEKVFLFHPAVSEVSGKEEVAELYKSFGLVVFCDMFPRAERNRELERQLRQAQAEVERIKQAMEELHRGIRVEDGIDMGDPDGDRTIQVTIDLSKVKDLPTLYRLIDRLKECIGGGDGEVQG